MNEPPNDLTLVSAFGPLAALFIVAAGIALNFQAKHLAGRLMVGAVASVVLFHIGGTVLEEIPSFVILIVLPLIVLGLLGQFFSLFIGRRAADVAIGNIVASLITAAVVLLFVPFKWLRRLLERWGST